MTEDLNDVKKSNLESIYSLKSSFVDSQQSTNTIRISPDGSKLATCSSDGSVRIYEDILSKDGSPPKLVTTLLGHSKGVSCIEFSPVNSNIIASCSDDLTIRIWSISKLKCVKILQKHTYHITTIKFNSKGNLLILGSADENITIWDVLNSKPIKTLAAHSDPISSIALTPDNSIIVSASYDGLMRLFDTELGQCLKTLTYNSSSYGTATALTNDVVNVPITNVECTPNGKYILSSSLDGTIRLWNYMDNKVVKTYVGVDGGKVCEKFSCGAKFITGTSHPNPLIVSGSDSSGVLIWDVQSKRIISRLDTPTKESNPKPSTVLDIDVYDQGRILVSCTRDGTVQIYEMS